MNSTTIDKNIHSLPEAIKIAGEQIRCLLNSDLASHHGQCWRIELKIESQNLLSWFRQQQNPVKIFWANRDEQFTVAGVGSAHTISENGFLNNSLLVRKIQSSLSSDYPSQRYYGGICFDQNNCGEEWKNFGITRFVLPKFELFADSSGTYFACNIILDEDSPAALEQILNELPLLAMQCSDSTHTNYQILTRSDSPHRDQWGNIIHQTVKNIQDGNYQKIVLARKTTFAFNETLDPSFILQSLRQTSPQCYIFLFEFNDAEMFLGATPEQLFKHEGSLIYSEAIAGTRPRGTAEAEDQQLIHELANSPKDAHEHRLVVHMIKNELERFCQSLRIDDNPSVLRLKGGHHLISRMEGTLKEKVSTTDLLSALHPTPAVAGTPTDKALKEIQTIEPFSRGWYTGPIGYIGKNIVEFAVALRCGLLKKNLLSLFSGAGIVAGSTADSEWNEVEQKLQSVLKVFP